MVMSDSDCCLVIIWGKCNANAIFVLNIYMRYNFPSIRIQQFDVAKLLQFCSRHLSRG